MDVDATRDAEISRYVRTELLRRIAHDVRGPASVMSQALGELDLALATGAATERLLAMVRRSVRRLTRLADRLSMIAELEQDAINLERMRVDLREIARAAAEDAAQLHVRRQIQLRLELGETAAFVNADERWLAAAIMEVCSNAIRFARKEVVVRVSTGETAKLVVEDDGPGFRVEAPWNARWTAREHVSGLGLSLALAHDVVEAHGGSLVVAPKNGSEGAAVALELLPAA